MTSNQARDRRNRIGSSWITWLLRRAPALAGQSVADGQPKHSEQLARFAEQNVLVGIGNLARLGNASRAQEVSHG